MTELIKIQETEGKETVNARDLHCFLESKRKFSDWIKQRIESYGFEYDVDFTDHKFVIGKTTIIDYYISIDMAKELSMVENNEKGKEARRYFIEVEKRARQLSKPQLTEDEILRNAFLILDSKVKNLENKIEADKDKVQFYQDVTGSRDAIEMSKAAKIINCGMGRTKLFQFLRENGVLRKNNEPYQKYIDLGWFRVIENKYSKPTGEICISLKTLVHQKGINGIIKMIRNK